jgi:hypothetical protein
VLTATSFQINGLQIIEILIKSTQKERNNIRALYKSNKKLESASIVPTEVRAYETTYLFLVVNE